MIVLRPFWLLGAALLLSPLVQAQQIQRELGDFDFKLATTPTRSMAEGLISPSAVGTFHGGVDLSHANGLYFGQYAPSMGLTKSSTLKLDNYFGYKQPLSGDLGYEVGVIHYSYPTLAANNSYALYGGLSLLGRRIGGAFNDKPSNRTGTLFANLGRLPLFGVDLSVKVAHHQFSTPYTIGDGSRVDGFSDWSLKFSRPWRGVDLNLTWSNSNLSGSGCDAYSGINNTCDSMVTLKAQRSFF
ncbi:TorF family putative porin [Pseudomonas cremoricolorata]|uniref:TorF family putative porin n=1 Tax=Pseudomonas cremoricolorata TaxID=157783 RepID=UPI0004058CDB|nr:TorF family putative porin [Pseudomonas cremoricolorata]